MLRFKPEVRVAFWSEPLSTIVREASLWSLRAGVEVEVNSIDDGADIHIPTSRHGSSLAVDLDTVGDRRNDTRALAEFLWRVLPEEYDVVDELDHVHVEFDVHRPPLRRTT